MPLRYSRSLCAFERFALRVVYIIIRIIIIINNHLSTTSNGCMFEGVPEIKNKKKKIYRIGSTALKVKRGRMTNIYNVEDQTN